MGFKVMAKQCSTCIYRKDSPLDLAELEKQIADPYGGFKKHRICHHATDDSGTCCRGFWDRHKNEFPVGQIAQRLNRVEFVKLEKENEL